MPSSGANVNVIDVIQTNHGLALPCEEFTEVTAPAALAPTDAELASAVARDTDADAALELYTRYGNLVGALARRHADGVVYDSDDARQDCFLAVYTAAARMAERPSLGFAAHYRYAAAGLLQEESQKNRNAVVIPRTAFRAVEEAVKAQGSPSKARDWLATEAPAHMRMTPETFDQVWYLSFGRHLEWGDPAARGFGEDEGATVADVTPDTSTERSFQSVEDRDAVARLVSTLSPTWQDVIRRLYGLDGYGEHTSQAVGAALGMNPAAVRRIHSKVLARLQVSAPLPATYKPKTETRGRLKSTVGGNRQEPIKYDFPVTVRRAA